MKKVCATILFLIFFMNLSACNLGGSVVWSDIVLGEMLPEPPNKKGTVWVNNNANLSVHIENVSSVEYAKYMDDCAGRGYTLDVYIDGTSYKAFNSEGYKLTLYYYEHLKKLDIGLNEPIKMVTFSWPKGIAGQQLPVPQSALGKVNYEYDDSFSLYIGETTREDYDAYLVECSNAGFNVNYRKDDNSYDAYNSEGWHVYLEYEGNNVMSIVIYAPKEAETTEPVLDSADEQTKDPYIIMNCNSSAYVGMIPDDVKKDLMELGFENVLIRESVSTDNYKTEYTVDSVTIGSTEFYKGDKFEKDVEIVIVYYKNEVENITIENNIEFSELMRITDQTDAETIRSFVNSHKGETIEFDGCIALLMKHGNYNTRFDICIVGGNYTDDRVYGPLFAFEDVNFYDMNVSGADKVEQAMSFRVEAKITGFNNEGCYIVLEPVSMVAR